MQLLRLLRIHHWSKNALVFAGVFFSGLVFTPTLYDAFLVFVTFSLASSIIYILNDIIDKTADQYHPKKKHRPIASVR